MLEERIDKLNTTGWSLKIDSSLKSSCFMMQAHFKKRKVRFLITVIKGQKSILETGL